MRSLPSAFMTGANGLRPDLPRDLSAASRRSRCASARSFFCLSFTNISISNNEGNIELLSVHTRTVNRTRGGARTSDPARTQWRAAVNDGSRNAGTTDASTEGSVISAKCGSELTGWLGSCEPCQAATALWRYVVMIIEGTLLSVMVKQRTGTYRKERSESRGLSQNASSAPQVRARRMDSQDAAPFIP